jgi:thiamine transport system substrate-binding protein
MNPRTRLSALVVAGALLAAAAGCSNDTDGASPKQSRDAATPTVTIVTYSSYVIDDNVKAEVEKDLGVKLKVSANGDGAEALSAAILTAGKPEGDIFFGVDNTLLTRAQRGDVFERIAASDLPELSSVPVDLQLDGEGLMYPIDVGPVCVDYDTTWFRDHDLAPPSTLADLTDPKYKDLLVVESPVTSSTGLVFLMATHSALGDGANDFWEQLVGNGVSVAGSWDDAWEAQYTVSGGDRPMVVSYASSPPAEVFYSEGKVKEPRTAVATATCADQIEFAAVLKGTKQPKLATKVLNAMLGATWQASLPLANFVYPARDGVDPPELFTEFAPRPDRTIPLDPAAIDSHRDDWIRQWRDIVE